MSHEPGCGYAAGYCDSPWLELAQEEPTQPLLAGCTVSTERRPGTGVLVLGWLFWARLRSARRERRVC